jgi:hypothetical protein
MEHGHRDLQVADEVDVMLDDDRSEVESPGKRSDEFTSGVRLLGRHARRRLV